MASSPSSTRRAARSLTAPSWAAATTSVRPGIAVAGDGAAVVAGTLSPEYPVTAGGFDQTFNGIADAFVTTLDPAGANLVDSTFLGGSDSDSGTSVALGGGAIHVTGGTSSADFPTTRGAFDTKFKQRDAFQAFATKLVP
jgi:hypothetical protein